MFSESQSAKRKPADVFSSLLSVCKDQGLDALGERMGELQTLLNEDMHEIELSIGDVGRRGETLVHQAAKHLLDHSGKRIRPVCVVLAARTGDGFTPAARKLAVAVELVHNATLLHDDVVDLGERRRGVDAARMIYGNAVSIFGGDYLLTEALYRIVNSGISKVLERMLDVIQEMVMAEALQMAKRGQFDSSIDEYFRIVSGKTASLFRWAMYAGARAGGAGEAQSQALERYGENLGIAFQLVDDVLDFTGAPELTGKTLLSDLREGKMTYPLLLTLERDPGVRPVLMRVYSEGDNESGGLLLESALMLKETMAKNGVIQSCAEKARNLCDEAVTSLDAIALGPAKEALSIVANGLPDRKR